MLGNRKKILKRAGFAFFFLVVLSHITSSCLQFRMTTKEVEKHFENAHTKPKFNFTQGTDPEIHYAEIGNDSLPMVIFLHGAPGSWSAFIDYMKDEELLQVARLVAIDRPGYGHSNFGQPEISLTRQAALIKPILELNKNKQKPVLIGHSLGGPLVARLAMDYPELVGGIIMVAPSIDPSLEKQEWYRPIGRARPFRWFLPRSLFVTNEEIYFLKDELTAMLPLWKNVHQPVTIIQGEKDKLVPPGNAKFGQRMLVNADRVNLVLLKHQNHFIPWNNSNSIKEAILNHLGDNIEPSTSSAYE